MKKLNNKSGMTMAEMLIVVAIIAVLAGVAFIAVNNHQRSLGQLERDGIAKEIFVAAQNHLAVAYGEGYLGLEEPSNKADTNNPFGTWDSSNKLYYIVVNGSVSGKAQGIFEQMLPFGSIDETVRAGGSYIIRYQKDTGTVLDVFYCTGNGSPIQFNHTFFDNDNYDTVVSKAGDDNDNKAARRDYVNGSILGWYGGTGAASLPTTTLQPPTIEVENAEKLYVKVTNPNSANSNARLKLIIKGVDSKAQKAYELKTAPADADHVKPYLNDYFVILDDITTKGMHFGEIIADTNKQFIPGEDIEIQAVAFSTQVLANIAYSAKRTTNSLYYSISSGKETAFISNIRHLENLDKAISNLDDDGTGKKNVINISKVEQTDDFSWVTFQKEIINIETNQPRGTAQSSGYSQEIYKFKSSNSDTNGGYYLPIAPNYALTYNGQSHSISDVAVNITGNAGLFGKVSTVSAISNLELIDFTITGNDTATDTSTAGSLAGTLKGCTVTNVLARNSAGSSTNTITASTAGGLVGKTESGTTVQYSAAAVTVSGTTVGGLIGSASGSVTGCYSGGHTLGGSYQSWIDASHPFDVTGATAGGLIGSSSATINSSYSTCSVSGTSYGAGLVGEVTAGSVNNCYATGLIDKAGANIYAFIANKAVSKLDSFNGNYYYKVINEVEITDDNEKTTTVPMNPFPTDSEHPISDYIPHTKPLDLNAGIYNDFVGTWDSWNPARAFDSALVQYYSGRYTLRTVDELQNTEKPNGYNNWNQLFVKTHYGDWPSPEVFFVN